MNRIEKYLSILITIVVFSCSGTAVFSAEPKVKDASVNHAVKFFSDTFSGTNDLKRAIALRGLGSTGDKQLLPLFVAMMQSGDKELRLMATAMVADIGGKSAAPALLQRIEKDPSMAIRGEAWVQLGISDSISKSDVLKAATIDDEGIKIVAARALSRMGKAKTAREMLKKLTESRDPSNVAFARMTLLGLGDRRQYAKLLRIVRGPTTTDGVLIRLLNQIAEEKISFALPMAESMCSSDYSWEVRLRGFDVVSQLSPKGTQKLTNAFRGTDNIILRINILQMISERDDSLDQIKMFANGNADDLTTLVAKFEMGRKTNPTYAETVAIDMVKSGHPIYIEYLLNCMAEDLQKSKNPQQKKSAAGFYALPIVNYLSAVKINAYRMTANHDRASKAVELLANLGNDVAMKGLWDILSAPGDSPIKRLTAASLYRADNEKVCDFVKPLLKSGYPELKTYAALLLGKYNKPEAITILEDIQGSSTLYKTDLLSLVNWYIIKLSDKTTQGVADIAKTIK